MWWVICKVIGTLMSRVVNMVIRRPTKQQQCEIAELSSSLSIEGYLGEEFAMEIRCRFILRAFLASSYHISTERHSVGDFNKDICMTFSSIWNISVMWRPHLVQRGKTQPYIRLLSDTLKSQSLAHISSEVKYFKYIIFYGKFSDWFAGSITFSWVHPCQDSA